MPDWKEFEQLVARLHAACLPNAVVEHNVKLFGRRSNRMRQIDVLIRTTTGPYTTLIAIECKQKARAVGIGQVDEFSAKLSDIGAIQGIMIARKFDAGAKSAALSHNIRLLSYREAERTDWQRLLRDWAPFYLVKVEFTALPEFVDSLSREVPLEAVIEDTDGSTLGMLRDFYDDVNTAIRHDSSKLGELILNAKLKKTWVLSWDGDRQEISGFRFVGTKSIREYMVNVGLAAGHVIETLTGRR
ncbi:MAG TPA: restriction endonuclease [Longimicrobium sp.]|nr:restriction endonuclease [Longimicrobium sp.]